MARIRVEVLMGLGDVFGRNGLDTPLFDRETEEGSTVGEVLIRVAAEDQTFREAIFNPETGKLSEQVAVVVNDLLLEALKGLDTPIKDGDIIKFFPVIAGG